MKYAVHYDGRAYSVIRWVPTQFFWQPYCGVPDRTTAREIAAAMNQKEALAE